MARPNAVLRGGAVLAPSLVAVDLLPLLSAKT